MDASIRSRAEQLATEFAGQASTIEELNGLMRLMMKSALERMLNTEMDVHLGRRTLAVAEALPPPATTSTVDEPALNDASTASSPQRKSNRRNGRSRKKRCKAIWAR